MNLTTVPLDETARTCSECAVQRAQNLYLLGTRRVLELCCGPSLPVLKTAYSKYQIHVEGNDIDPRWKGLILGDALKIPYDGFDTVVFAPPLSRGCTGKREDSLMINEVFPSYVDFLKRWKSRLGVLVLPGRSMATRLDREQFYRLRTKLPPHEIVPLSAKKTVKYYDVYMERKCVSV